jgi:hypothetical protein
MRAWVAAVLVLVACGSSKSPANPDSGNGSGADAATDGNNNGWTTLISRTWDLGSGMETYKCRRIQIPTEMWISGFRAMSPVGTHHEVLTISTSGSSQTGDYDCSAGSLDPQMLYAAGVNTDDLVFPAGEAVHVPAGSYINLNLHLFNATDNALSGEESGVLVQTVPAASVVHEIDMTFSGTFVINVPSDGQPHTATGGCTANQDYHVFSLWPHMHQTGTHQTFTVTHAGTPTTLLDTPYMFTEQRNYPMAETVISANDQIQTTCTFEFAATCSSSQPCSVGACGSDSLCHVTFGESSTEEMCFTGIYKYPAASQGGVGLLGCVSM